MIRCGGLAAVVGAMALAGGAARGQAYQQPVVVPTGNWPRNFVAQNPSGNGGFVYFTTEPTSYNGVAYTAQNSMFLEQGANGSFTTSAGAFGGIFSSLRAGAGNILGNGRLDMVFAHTQPFSAGGITPQDIDIDVEMANGDGTYGGVAQGANFSVGPLLPVVGAVVVADIRGAGLADVAVLDSANGELYILLNHLEFPNLPPGLLIPTAEINLPGGGSSMIAGNFYGGKNLDLAVLGTMPEAVTVLRGNGDGTFSPGDTASLPGGIFSMLFADINGDGFPDLVVEGAGGTLSVFLGSATGFASTATPLTGAQDGAHGQGGHLVAIADLNGDGNLDIVTTTPAGVTVLFGQGNLTYKAGPTYNAGPGRSSYALGSFLGDGKLDLALDSPEGIAILKGDGKGGFDAGVTANTGQPAYSLALGDFSGSGDTDVVVATGVPQVQLMSGDGTGYFVAVNGPSPAGAAETNAGRTVWSHVVAGDFDEDGKLDAALSLDGPVEVDLGPCCTYPASDNGMSAMFGDGTGNFTAPILEGGGATGPHYGMLLASDIEGNGTTGLINYDAVSANFYRAAANARTNLMQPITEFVSFGDQYLRPYQMIATGTFKTGRTGGQDVIVESEGSSLSFSAEISLGGGAFGFGTQTFALPAGVAVLTENSSLLPKTGLYPSAMLLTDVDGDGNGDFLVVYHNLASDPANPSAAAQNLLYIFWGNGDGTFVPTPEIVTLSRNYYQLAVADVNGDGKPDLVMSDGYLVSVLAGDGTRSGFSQEKHYLAGMGINGLAVQDVNADGKADIVVANGGAVLSAGVVNRGVLAANAEVNTGGLTVLTSDAATGPTLGTVTGTVTASPNPVPFGEDIAFATALTGSETTAPTGTVVFYVGSLEIGTQTLTGGSASYTYLYNPGVPPIINAGTYTMTAQYSGDANYAAATLTGATPLVVTPVATMTTLVDIVSPIYYGQTIADTGLEETSPEPDGGTLDFLIDGVVTCSLTLTSLGGAQYCPPSTGAGYDAGTYMVQSVYSGDQNFLTSSSPVYTVVVLPDPTSASLTASTGTSSTLGQAVTLTAAIADAYTTARGTVNFFDGTTLIGTGTVNSVGQASYSTSALALGVHSLSACLVASLDFLASSPCGTLSFTVNPVVPPPPPPPGTFTLTVNPTAISVGVGNSVGVQVTVTALNGFSQPVQLGCSGLPFETTCTFGQSLIAAGGGSTVLLVSPSAPHNCGANPPDFVAPNARGGMAGLLLSVLAMFGLRRRRRLVKVLALVVLFSALSGLSGCGTQCKDFGTEPIDTTFTVTGASTGSPVVSETVTVKMKVHL